MRALVLFFLGVAGLCETACGGNSEPARSSSDADETRHDAPHSADTSSDKSEKVDRAADQVDKAAGKAESVP